MLTLPSFEFMVDVLSGRKGAIKTIPCVYCMTKRELRTLALIFHFISLLPSSHLTALLVSNRPRLSIA